jgi:hypothetical protein
MTDHEETYQETLDRMVAEKKPRAEIVGFIKQNNQHVIDLDNLPQQKHNWVDRGLKLSCEDAGHPYHQVWKPRKQY